MSRLLVVLSSSLIRQQTKSKQYKMNKSDIRPMPEYFDRYINLCDDVSLKDALQTSINEVNAFPLKEWEKIGNKVYTPGKWTIKDILQHLIDTERIFAYRALAFSRGETALLPSFDEDRYAAAACATERNLEEIIVELKTLHESTKMLFNSFNSQMLLKTGMGFKGEYSVLSIGFCMLGHQRWHMKVIEEKYMALLK